MGATPSNRRALVFLVTTTPDKIVNAKVVLDQLVKKGKASGYRFAYDLWLQGADNKHHRHHGWTLSQHGGKYQHCHVFKDDQQRMLGFKCNPFPDQPRKELCVLVHVPKLKSQAEINPRDLDVVMLLKDDPAVRSAIAKYCEGQSSTHKGLP